VTRLAGRAGVAAAVAAAMLAVGCGSAAPATRTDSATPAITVPLDTSVATAAGTWATVVMGGSAAQYNDFWQLFIRPAGASSWKLVTPPGTDDNGGLVLAAGAGQSAITAFRPSQDLTYTPLTQSSDAGGLWLGLDPLDAALASTPGALAVQPGPGRLLALTGHGAAEEATPAAGRWTTLATVRSLAGTPAGRACGLSALTAVAFAPAGAPMLAGECSRPGTAGIFTASNGVWRAAGLSVPASLASQDITVLRLAVAGGRVTALIQAGSGRAASVLAAWSATGTSAWTTAPTFPLGSSALSSASFGPAGTVAVTTTAGTGAVIGGAASPWLMLPRLPSGTKTISLVAGGTADALAARGSTLTVWQLPAGGGAWTRAQVISVPIQYGSSS
jgi:hypothetical protein